MAINVCVNVMLSLYRVIYLRFYSLLIDIYDFFIMLFNIVSVSKYIFNNIFVTYYLNKKIKCLC